MRDVNGDDSGFVTQFDIPEDYFKTFEVQTVGLAHHKELWVPAEQLNEFNEKIVGEIKVLKAFVGARFIMTEEIKNLLNKSQI